MSEECGQWQGHERHLRHWIRSGVEALLGEGNVPHNFRHSIDEHPWPGHNPLVVLLDGDKQIVPLSTVHEIWDQRVMGVEQLVPDLPEHVVTMQSFDRKAYGMRWVADDNQNIREELARREEDGAPLLRCAICGNAEDFLPDVFLQRLIARQWLWCSASGHTAERRAETCQEVIQLLHRRDSVIFFKILRVFLGTVQEAQDACCAEP